MSILSPVLAQIGQPLFGSPWMALLAIMGGVTVFLFAVAGVGRWLAATHPDEPPPPFVPVTEASPEVFAIIAASVASTMGETAKIAGVAVVPPPEPATETGRLQWSMEGRRQIYSSHKVR